MGFRVRKSFGGKAFRVNVSKSGIGYSTGVKGFRVTKKAGGGMRTTSSIPGTGISYSSDYGKRSTTTRSSTTRQSTNYSSTICPNIQHNGAPNSGNPKPNCVKLENQSISHPTKSFVIITVLLSFWWFYFVPLVFGIKKICDFCKELNQFKKDYWTESAENHQFKIIQKDNTESSFNIVIIAFLCNVWFLVFPLFLAKKMIDTYIEEFNFIKDAYEKKQRDLKIAQDQERTKLIKVLLNNNIKRIERQEQSDLQANIDAFYLIDLYTLRQMATEQVENYQRIMKDSSYIVDNTTNIETFFSRFELLLGTCQLIIPFEECIKFNDPKPSQVYQEIMQQREEAIEQFVSRHLAFIVDDASTLKTERGKKARYKKSYDQFVLHYGEIGDDNISYIESEFATLLADR